MKQNNSVMEKNPVVRTAKLAVSLMKNKLIASLLLLIQGILFIVSPTGTMQMTVQIGAVVIILACAVNILLHLLHKDRTKADIVLSVLNMIVIAAGVFCLISPQTVEPYVRVLVGIVMILTNLVNLIETLKLEERHSWKFAVGTIAAIVMMGLGVVLAFTSGQKAVAMQQAIGVFLILNALTNIWYVFRLRHAERKASR